MCAPGANINALNNGKETPLDKARSYKCHEVARFLVDSGECTNNIAVCIEKDIRLLIRVLPDAFLLNS